MREEQRRKARILVVDDEIAVVDVFRDILARHGYASVEGTINPFDAVALFERWQPDLVVLDLLMPGIGGLHVLQQLRAMIPADTYLPIVMVTGHPSVHARREALGHGANDFIVKPYDPLEILLRVDNLLDTRFLQLEISARQADLDVRVVERTAQLTDVDAALRHEITQREAAEAALQAARAELETQVRRRTYDLKAANDALVLKISERRRAQVEAEQANRAKSEFLSRMSHELRTPLNAILGFGQLLKTECGDVERVENLDQILAAGRHLLALVDEVLNIAQAEAGVLALPGGAVEFGAEAPADLRQSSRPAAPAAAAARPSTVLYIEDNQSNLRLVERILGRRPGITLLHAAKGQLGLELAREHQPALILLDLHLPDMHGEQVLEQLVRDRCTADTPVIVISADATTDQITRLTAAGARAYLTKPLDVSTFLASVDGVLRPAGEPATP